jgi:hypothetical protein
MRREGTNSLPFAAVAILCVAIVAGCASPGTPVAAVAPAANAQPADAPPGTAKPASAGLAAENGSRYQRVVKGKETFYCAQEEFVGSRVQKQVCLNETEYEAMREANRKFMHQIQTMPVPAYDPTKQNQ